MKTENVTFSTTLRGGGVDLTHFAHQSHFTFNNSFVTTAAASPLITAQQITTHKTCSCAFPFRTASKASKFLSILACVFIMISAASKAPAQGPPPGYGPSWQVISTVVNGTSAYTADGVSFSQNWSDPEGASINTSSSPVGVQINVGVDPTSFMSSASANTQGNAVVTFKWVGNGIPPAYFSALLTDSASCGVASFYSDSTVTASQSNANDGYGDLKKSVPPTFPLGLEYTSTAPHLMKVSVQNGIAVVTIPVVSASIVGSFIPGMEVPNESGEIYAQASLNIAYDTRQLSISSSVSPTWHKGPNGAAVENIPASDGTLSDDTVQPLSTTDANGNITTIIPDLTAVYSGSYFGSWYQYSGYHWYSSMKTDSGSGTFNPYMIGTLSETYTSNDFPTPSSTPNDKTEHIFLSGIDSKDGARATANYYLKFHQPFENYFQTGHIPHPQPSSTTVTYAECDQARTSNGSQLGDYKVMGPYQNTGSVAEPINPPITVSYAATEGTTGDITTGESATLNSDLITAGYQQTLDLNITQSQTVTITYSNPNAMIPPDSDMYVYWAQQYDEYTGQSDYYNVHGYAGIAYWDYKTYTPWPGGIPNTIMSYVTQPAAPSQ